MCPELNDLSFPTHNTHHTTHIHTQHHSHTPHSSTTATVPYMCGILLCPPAPTYEHRNTHPDQSFVGAAEAVHDSLSNIIHQLNTNVDIYHAVSSVTDDDHSSMSHMSPYKLYPVSAIHHALPTNTAHVHIHTQRKGSDASQRSSSGWPRSSKPRWRLAASIYLMTRGGRWWNWRHCKVPWPMSS